MQKTEHERGQRSREQGGRRWKGKKKRKEEEAEGTRVLE